MEFDALAPSTARHGEFQVEVRLAPHPAVQAPVRQQRATVTVRWPRDQSLEVQTLLFRWART